MEIWWIPQQVRELFGDILMATDPWKFMYLSTRRHQSFKDTKAAVFRSAQPNISNWIGPCNVGYCAHCADLTELACHHIIPLWVLSLELIIRRIHEVDSPETPAHLMRHAIHRLDFIKEEDVRRWNSRENVTPLCRSCHERAESKAYRFFKGEFRKKYPDQLFWKYEEAWKAWNKRQPRY